MTKYVWHNGAWVRAIRVSRPPLFPGIITDTMTPAMHPATGQMMDSKSAFRRVTKAHGLVELGNDAPTTAPPVEPDGVKEDVVEAIQMLNQGYTPEPVAQAEADIRHYEH